MGSIRSENAFLHLINAHFPNTHSHMLHGRGDDCAIIRCPKAMCVSSDLFLEDVHFRSHYFTAADIGYKALAVNLSDIASSGAKPLGFSLGLMVVDGKEDAYWDTLFEGMAALAREHDVALTGGDLSQADKIGLSVTVWGGLPAPDALFLTRGVCTAGDAIFTVGTVGLARTGLLSLEALGQEACAQYPEAVRAHLHPTPRIQAGQAIARFAATLPAEKQQTIGLMDMSDGLARDLPRLLGTDSDEHPPALTAELTVTEDAIHPETKAYASANNRSPLEEYILGGEDYALLGTCPPSCLPHLQHLLPNLRCIGHVCKTSVSGSVAPGTFTVNGRPWQRSGFDHFSA